MFKDNYLIINTCGYVNNIGELLLYDMYKML